MFSLLLSISLLSNFLPNHPNVKYEKTPDWVVAIAPAEAQSTQQGRQYLLTDHQINVETDEAYTHIVYKVLEDGAEGSSTEELEFDPAYETLALNKLVISRNGQEIVPSLEGNVRLLQRELQLSRNIYNGIMTLHFILGDVREGDLIDLAYTIKGKNPVFGKYFFQSKALSFRDQIEKLHYRVVHNGNLQFKTFNADYTMEERQINDSLKESVLLLSPTKITNDIPNTPYFYMPWQLIQTSNFQSWQELSEWGSKLFAIESSNDAFNNIVQPWLDFPKEDRVIAALNFVQNEISYMGIEESIYSHQPHSPLVTLNNRYGDCKDKTLLLKALLNEMDIEATPSLVNTHYLNAIKSWFPSPYAFNHVILFVSLDGYNYWLDPTHKYQAGSLADYSQDFYGCYLLLNGQKDCLALPSLKWGNHETHIHTRFDLEKKSLNVQTKLLKNAANTFRSLLANEGKEFISKDYKEYYAKLFGSAEIITPLDIQDDRKNNVMATSENYFLDDLFDETNTFAVTSQIAHHIPQKVPLSRKAPLDLTYPNVIQEVIRVSSDRLQDIEESEGTLEHPSFVFKYKALKEKNDLVMQFSYQSKMGYIEPKDFKLLRELIPKIHDRLSYVVPYDELSPMANEAVEEPLEYSLWPAAVLLLCLAAFIIHKARKPINAEELAIDKIKKKWRTAFWIYFGPIILFLLTVTAISVYAKNIELSILFLTLLFIQSCWATFLYRKSYQQNGTKLLGFSLVLLTMGIANPLNIYFLIRSIKLFRYNRTLKKMANC